MLQHILDIDYNFELNFDLLNIYNNISNLLGTTYTSAKEKWWTTGFLKKKYIFFNSFNSNYSTTNVGLLIQP